MSTLKNKHEFDFLLHEVKRDVTNLRHTKASHPEYIDDYVLEQLDEIQLMIRNITGD